MRSGTSTRAGTAATRTAGDDGRADAPDVGDVHDDAAALRAAGLYVTQPRLAALAVVHDRPHATIGEIVAGVKSRLGTVSRQAVYDVLNALIDAGIVRRFQPAGLPARYEVRANEGVDHDHAVCRRCGRIVDVHLTRTTHAPAGDPLGFVVDEIDVTYWGTCHTCQRAGSPAECAAGA